MSKYRIGDIVSVIGLERVCFIITDIENTKNNSLYTMIKVYPANEAVVEFVANDEGIESSIKSGDEDYPFFMEMLNEEFSLLGYDDLLDFLGEVALTVEKEDKQISKVKNHSIGIMTEMEDAIFYHEIRSITECTKAMIDLKDLFMRFGDEAYLQLHDLVVKRFEKVVKYEKETDKLLDVMNDLRRLDALYGDEKYVNLHKSVLNHLTEMR